MHIHILGICGTFMGGIARLARELGHTVTGADQHTYPPMSTQLESLGIALDAGYGVTARLDEADVVVVGNALTRGLPAVEHLLDSGRRLHSGPQWLAEEVLHDRLVVAVAGTHGKTTTSSMAAWLLDRAGLDPGFLIGGVPGNFGCSARLGSGRPFVIEADEYDTAFFDKRAKFVHYRPHILVLNNLEFDHADIYADLAAIERQFHHLLRIVPGSGRVIVRHADPALRRVLELGCWTPVESFGDEPDAGWRLTPTAADYSRLRVARGDRILGNFDLSTYGRHNALNALGAMAAACHAGMPASVAATAMPVFRNAQRRLQVLAESGGITLYDDFAHHPTAIRETLAALRGRIGDARIVAILEPRSNTMRSGVHADTLSNALRAADRALLFEPPDLSWDLQAATADLPGRSVHDSVDAILEALAHDLRPGDHVVIMSNGAFGGLNARAAELVRRRSDAAERCTRLREGVELDVKPG